MRPRGCALFSFMGLGAMAFGVYLVSSTPLSFVAFMGGGIFAGAMHSLKYDNVQATVVALDRRCSATQYRFSEMAPNSCSDADIQQRKADFEAPPPPPIRKGKVVTEYPAKKMPAPGIAIATVKYVGPDGAEHEGVIRASSLESHFYQWQQNQKTAIQVCRHDPKIIRISILQWTAC